jgi:hypothetical protein
VIQHEKSKCKVDFVSSRRVFIDEQLKYTFDDADIEIDMNAYE